MAFNHFYYTTRLMFIWSCSTHAMKLSCSSIVQRNLLSLWVFSLHKLYFFLYYSNISNTKEKSKSFIKPCSSSEIVRMNGKICIILNNFKEQHMLCTEIEWMLAGLRCNTEEKLRWRKSLVQRHSFYKYVKKEVSCCKKNGDGKLTLSWL